MAIEIRLSREEWLFAAMKGCERQIDGAEKKRHPSYGSPEKRTNDGWFWNINGAAGELVVANWLGVPWDAAFGNLGASDVADLLEVRTTPGHDFPLRLHEPDPNDRLFILVTGVGPVWRIQGYLLGRRGKRTEWFHDKPPPVGKPTGRPAYWVEQKHLQTDFDKLRERFTLWLARNDLPARDGPRREPDQEANCRAGRESG